MRKLSLFVALALVLSLFAGCAGTPVVYYADCTCPTSGNDAVQTPADDSQADQTTAEGALKTGMAVLTSVASSASANAEAEGVAKYDLTMVAVLVDDEGIIRDCVIDGVSSSQANIKFNAEGVITSDLTAAPATKLELGDAYGMKAKDGGWGAQFEWYEQAESFANYVIGKTAADVAGIAVDENTKPTGADLTSSVTISVGDFITAVQTAAANAKHLGAKAGDELKLVTITAYASCSDATAEKAGNAELDVDVAALTVKNGVITSCVIDAVQGKVAFDTEGQITSDVKTPVKTKNELGDDYGMKAKDGGWGGQFEWYEQSASFAEYVTEKTAAEVAGIAVDENTKPTGADLTNSVTIKIGGFQALIAKAFAEEAADLKTGMAVLTSVASSASANAEAEGVAKYDLTMVAVLVDDEGIIRDCVIDGISSTQANIKFNAEGVITSDLTAAPATKLELGDAYGMKAKDGGWGAQFEWYEQAESFANYVIGKTAADVAGIAVDENTKPTGADLTSSVTISVGDFITAVQTAAANAKHLGAKAGDELKLVTITAYASCSDATAEKAGNAELDVDVAALTVKNGVITSCVIDAVQGKVAFDTEGQITSDVKTPVKTKNELGDDYGMKAKDGGWGGQFEWYEQSASFAEYVTEKTAAEVAGIAVDENTKPTGADLTNSVTIKIGGFQALIAKAFQ